MTTPSPDEMRRMLRAMSVPLKEQWGAPRYAKTAIAAADALATAEQTEGGLRAEVERLRDLAERRRLHGKAGCWMCGAQHLEHFVTVCDECKGERRKAEQEATELRERCERLEGALREAIAYMPDGFTDCNGYKCRQPNCQACFSEAENGTERKEKLRAALNPSPTEGEKT